MRGAARRRWRPLLLCALAWAGCSAPAVFAQNGAQAGAQTGAQWSAAPAPDGAELRIVELTLRDRQVVASDLLAWQTADGNLLLPFADIIDAAGFRIDMDASGASGWFLRESQLFALNVAAGTVDVAGRRFDLAPGDVAEIDGVPHVSAAALNRWFALGVTWIADRQVVSLAPSYLLAGEENARRGGAGGATAEEDYSSLPWQSAAPGWLSWPYLTANMGVAAQSGNQRPLTTQTSLLAQGDLLGTSAQMALSLVTPGRFDGRLTLMRQDPAGRLLGPLRATEMAGGDISLQPVPLLLRNGNGLGATISRGRLNAAGRFDQADLVGGAPPGWQAELYRDSQLLGFQTIGSDGRYNFPAIPLQFGANRFRIQLYGPSGERQTILRNFDIASDLVAPGALTYALAAIRQGRTLFRKSLFDFDAVTPQGGDPRGSAFLFNPRGLHMQAQLGYGISRSLSLQGLFARREEEGGLHASYVGGGLGWRFGTALMSATVLQQGGGGMARRVALLAGLRGTSVTLEHDGYDRDFLSDENRIAPNVTTLSRDSVTIDGRIGQAGWNLSAVRNRRSDGGADRFASLRGSMVTGPLSITPRISYRDISLTTRDDRDRRFDGGIAVAGAIGNWRLRANMDVDIRPRTRLRNVGADLSLRLQNWYLSGAVEHDRLQPSTRFRLAASRDWNGVRLGAETRYDAATRSVAAFLTLAFAIDRAPDDGHVRLGRAAKGNAGTVIARLFEDRNGDGRMDAGEPVVPGATAISAPRGQGRQVGDAIIMESLPIDRAIAILPDLSGVDSPYLTPATPGVQVAVRGGAVTRVDLPLVSTGEIELMVQDKGGSPVSGKVVTLASCDRPGDARRVRSAFDGRLIADGIRAGCYELKDGDVVIGRIDVRAEQVTSATIILPEAATPS